MAENNSNNTNEDGLRKGPWSIEEDMMMMLTEYVGRFGEENWNAVQNNYGLLRCGQSCRLRWFNHLKPGLKKRAISAEEERTIVELHVMFGNKWAKMATQLPGRTDKKIKNFWNSRLRKLERARLPLYPPKVLVRAEAYRLQQKEEQFASPPLAGNTGLLVNLVLDFENLSLNNKGKNIMADQDGADDGNNNTVKKNNADATNKNRSNELGNFQFPPGANPIGVYLEEMNDYDDLLSLIDFSAGPADQEFVMHFLRF